MWEIMHYQQTKQDSVQIGLILFVDGLLVREGQCLQWLWSVQAHFAPVRYLAHSCAFTAVLPCGTWVCWVCIHVTIGVFPLNGLPYSPRI